MNRKNLLSLLGAAALAAGALLLAPRVIDRLSGLLYAPPLPPAGDDESWGPEIVRTAPAADEEPEPATSAEEDKEEDSQVVWEDLAE